MREGNAKTNLIRVPKVVEFLYAKKHGVTIKEMRRKICRRRVDERLNILGVKDLNIMH